MKSQKLSFLVVVVLNLWIHDSLAIEYAPVIETNKGPVRGTISRTVKQSLRYFSYRNIPFAKPPVGYLRFQPPVEVDPWNNVLDAVVDGPVCPQIENGRVIGQEDCLNLNVYTPELPRKDGTDHLKPVMFWIYGGSFTSGYNRKSLYSPDYLIEEGVVCVAVNYRLGVLGFLALGHPNATGNAALKDQNLALRWVRDNIAKFGGDPKKVTIFGQSAGGASVDLQILSERSKGLFHRAITMSGSSIIVWALHTPNVARQKAFQLARNLGFKGKTIESLLQFYYKADAKSLVEMTSNLTIVDPPFKATIENSSLGSKEDLFLTECPLRIYESGNFNQVPRILGYMKDEALAGLGVFENTLDTEEDLKSYLKLFNLNNSLFNALNPIAGTVGNATTYITIFTDLLFIAPIDYTQRLLSKFKSPVYYYRYTYYYNNSLHQIFYNVSENGAAHGDEIPMIFYSDSYQTDPHANNTRELVQRRMTRLWTNFAKFGNPTPNGTKDKLLNIVWPDARPNGKMLEISDKLKVRDRYITIQIKTIESAMKIFGWEHNGCVSGLEKTIDNVISIL